MNQFVYLQLEGPSGLCWLRLGAVLALMIWRGAIDPRIWLIVAVAFPFSVLGTQTGIFVFRRLNDRQFQQLLIWLIFISGLVVGGREIVTYDFFDY